MQKLAAVFFRAATWIRAHRWLSLGCLVAVFLTVGITQATVVSADTTAETVSKYVLSAVTGSWLINFLAWMLNSLAGIVGQLIVTLIDAILVPILNYDGFATSAIVDLGWSLVRDTVNMFVVVILLVIAALTIVGSPKANWQQQIPRLFIFTVAVNFSRTICGIAIDISNVVMFQFVNAILVVGAGNFAQLLQINYYGDYSVLESVTTGAAQNFATAWLQLALMLAVLGVILIMTIVYLYRIVVLWLLIIMSPMAFFAGGIKDIVGPAGGIYGQWMKKFTSALFLGPVLTFFLWLALAAASGGSIVTNENFPVGEATEGFGIALKVLEMSNLTSLLLGLVLLVIGMQMAGSFAGDLGEFAGKLINGGMGQTLAKRAIGFPMRGFRPAAKGAMMGMGELGRQFDRRIGAALDSPERGHRGSVLSHLGAQVMRGGESVRTWGAQNGLAGAAVGATVGRGLSSAGDRVNRQGEHLNHDAQHNSDTRVNEWSDERLLSELRIAAAGGNPVGLSNRDARLTAFRRLMTTRSLQRQVEAFPDGTGRDVLAAAMHEVQAHRDHLLPTDNDKTVFDSGRSNYADGFVRTLAPGAQQEAEAAALQAFITSNDFVPRVLRAGALEQDYSGTPEAARHNRAAAAIEAGLRAKVMRMSDDGQPITAWQEMTAGAYGPERRRAAEGRGVPPIDNAAVRVAPPAPAGGAAGPANYSPDQIVVNIRSGRLNVNQLDAPDFAAANPNADNLTSAILQLDRGRDVPQRALPQFMANATRLADADAVPPAQRAQVDTYNLRNAGTPNQTPNRTNAEEVFRQTPTREYDVARMANAVELDPLTIRFLAGAIGDAVQGAQVSSSLANVMTPQTIQALARAYGTANAGMRAQIQEAVTNASNAVVNRMEQNPPPAGGNWEQHNARLNELYEQLEATATRVGAAAIRNRPPNRP